MPTAVRTRRRVPAAKKTFEVSDEIKALVHQKYVANKEKNAATGREKKAEKELATLVAQASDGEPVTFEHTFCHDDKEVTAVVGYGPTESVVVDLEELSKRISPEDFMACVKATQGDVKAVAGENILNLVRRKVPGGFKLKVEVKK